MRECPNCQEATISRKVLYFSSLGIPGVVCACSNCHATVYIKDSPNIFAEIAKDIIVVAACLVTWYYFDSFYIGLVAFITWCLVKLYLKTNRALEYIT